MGFRFRRSLTLIPGVRINLSKRGSSLSIGGHGATVNYSKRGKRVTLGIPGSGMSYSETARPPDDTPMTIHQFNVAAASRRKSKAGLIFLFLFAAMAFLAFAGR